MTEIEPVVYHGHLVEVLPDGRWRYGGLTFETADDARYYLDTLKPLPYRCEECGYECGTTDEMAAHQDTCEGGDAE